MAAVRRGEHTEYCSAVRAEDDPLNQLMKTAWDGLRDKYVVAAIRKRSFVDVAFTAPMIFFTHSKLVKRPMIRTIMDCAEGFLEGLDSEGYRPVGEGLNARIDDSDILRVDVVVLVETFGAVRAEDGTIKMVDVPLGGNCD